MEEKIIIVTDRAGKNLYDTTNDTYPFYQERLDQLNRWITDLDKYEELKLKYQTGQDFSTLKNLYTLDALVTIAAIDLSIISTELYLNKSRLKQIFYMKQIYLLIYAAYETYNDKRQFLNQLITNFYPELSSEFEAISMLQKAFVKDYKLYTLVKDVRHRTGGHIHKDYRLWYDSVVNLDPQYTADMAIAFMKAFSPIQHLTMKLAGLEHEKFLRYSNESDDRINTLLDKIESLTKEVNTKQAEGLKVDFDLNVIRDLLK